MGRPTVRIQLPSTQVGHIDNQIAGIDVNRYT